MVVMDDFIKDDRLIETLADLKVWQKLQAAELCWWDGWWASPPIDGWQSLIHKIWSPNIAPDQIAGFEYWCNILTPQHEGLDWHYDKDEALAKNQKKIVTPLVGTIFYGFPHEFDGGGDLEIARPSLKDGKDPSQVERIIALHNRLVIFDASKLHRVTPFTSGIRVGLQINLWLEKPTGL